MPARHVPTLALAVAMDCIERTTAPTVPPRRFGYSPDAHPESPHPRHHSRRTSWLLSDGPPMAAPWHAVQRPQALS